MKKKLLAEFLGSFILCYLGFGASVLNSDIPGVGSLIFAFLIVGLGSGFGHISGAHINPSVSFALLCTKQMTIKDFCAFVVAQILGALCGFFFLYRLLKSLYGKVTNLACNGYGELSPLKISALDQFFFESFITCFYVYVNLTNRKKKYGSFISSFTIGCIISTGRKLTGGSMNPARSLAPAIIMGGLALKQVWLFILAPLAGAANAAFLFKLLNCECKKVEKNEKDEELVEVNSKEN
jgi:aquaporin Z